MTRINFFNFFCIEYFAGKSFLIETISEQIGVDFPEINKEQPTVIRIAPTGILHKVF